jgi:CheY-like chemotaxis protein
MTPAPPPINILLVEDNPGDVRLTREALREFKVNNVMEVATDGVAALAHLRREGALADKARPDLILLDLNLPKKSGIEVLAEIKSDADLKRIPVVILTTSGAEQDVVKSYNLHANCYITKPVDLEQFVTVVRSIDDFWLTVVRLPPETRQ